MFLFLTSYVQQEFTQIKAGKTFGTVFAMSVEILRNSKKIRGFLTVRVLKSAHLFSQEIFNVSWRMGFIEDK